MNVPETRWAKTADGAELAFRVVGEGHLDLLFVTGWISHLEVDLEFAPYARFLRRLGATFRVITFDKRGTGMSDRVTRLPDLETMMDDVRSVLDAAGSERAALLGSSNTGGACLAVFAASFPERVLAFVWWNPSARGAWAPDYPWGSTEEEVARSSSLMEQAWGLERRSAEMLREMVGPSVADDPEAQRWFAKMCRYAATPSGARSFDRMWTSVDVRSVLTAIRVPTLLALRTGGALPEEDPEAEARYLADRIPGARLSILPGDGSPVFLGDQEEVVGTVEAFVRSVREEEAELDRVLATVLFTDIVGSTERAAELGDRAWRELVERHHLIIRSMLGRYRGTEVDTAGDGFFATFDGPARAARCALAIVDAVRPLGIEVRAGVHTGEVETTGEKVGGIAVHIGARIGALARCSEVLASSTVKDLVAGSGLTFQDRGEHDLKGVPDRWHLYRVTP